MFNAFRPCPVKDYIRRVSGYGKLVVDYVIRGCLIMIFIGLFDSVISGWRGMLEPLTEVFLLYLHAHTLPLLTHNQLAASC